MGQVEELALRVTTERVGPNVLREVAEDAKRLEKNLVGGMSRMVPQVKTGTSAMATLAYSVQGAGTSAVGLANAAGNVASSLAMMSTSAKVAASATGIGALVIAATTLYTILNKTKTEADEVGQTFERRFREIRSVEHLRHELELIDRQINQTNQQLAGLGKGRGLGLADVAGGVGGIAGAAGRMAGQAMRDKSQEEALAKRLVQLQEQRTKALDAGRAAARAAAEEAERAVVHEEKRVTVVSVAADHQLELMRKQSRALESAQRTELDLARLRATGADTLALQTRELQLQHGARIDAIGQMFTMRDLGKEDLDRMRELTRQAGDLLALKTREIDMVRAEREKAEAAGSAADVKRRVEDAEGVAMQRVRGRAQADIDSGDPMRGYEGARKQIELDAAAELDAAKGNESAILEIKTRTEDKLAALRKRSLRDTISNLKAIYDATRNSSNAQLKAVGTAANALRRLSIGAEAALAAVESKRNFAKIPEFLSKKDPMGAAFAFAAGTQLAAAAAFGLQESLGGGGSGGGGSGGGGSIGGEQGTFTPDRGGGGSGGVTLHLYTSDPYNPENIKRVIYEIDRSNMLKKPIFLPPTTGLGN